MLKPIIKMSQGEEYFAEIGRAIGQMIFLNLDLFCVVDKGTRDGFDGESDKFVDRKNHMINQ